MARICELTGKRPMKGSIIWRSGKSRRAAHWHARYRHHQAAVHAEFAARKSPGRRRGPLYQGDRQRTQKGLVVKAPKRTWKPDEKKKS